MSRDTVTACSTVHTVLILSRHASRYRDVIQQAELPRVNLLTSTDPAALDGPEAGADIVLGEPSLIAAALPRARRVRRIDVRVRVRLSHRPRTAHVREIRGAKSRPLGCDAAGGAPRQADR